MRKVRAKEATFPSVRPLRRLSTGATVDTQSDGHPAATGGPAAGVADAGDHREARATTPRSRVGRRLRRPAVVTFSGLDGAGKSSQTQLLQEVLARQQIDAALVWVPVAINPSVGYIKAFGKRMLRRAMPSARKGGHGAGEATQLDPGKRLVRRSALARHVWSSFVTLTNVFSHWSSYLRHYGADVVIFDRYAIDTAVRLHTWYGELGSVDLQVWLIQRLSPRPTSSYFLDVAAESALARKVDKWDLGMLRRQRELYRIECARFRVRTLDGERSVEDLAVEISTDVLQRLGKKGFVRSAPGRARGLHRG